MKKYIRIFALMSACAVMLAGCGSAKLPEVIEKTTISIDDNGGITSYLVEEFNKEYYDVSELTAMAVEDAAAYSEEHPIGEGVPLTVEKVELLGSGNRVMVQHVYSNAAIYADYNEGVMFYGTVEEAVAEGFDLTAILTSVKDNQILSQEELMKKPEKTHVLITDEKAAIYCPQKVTHVGEGAVYQEDGSVDTTTADGVVVVLMK